MLQKKRRIEKNKWEIDDLKKKVIFHLFPGEYKRGRGKGRGKKYGRGRGDGERRGQEEKERNEEDKRRLHNRTQS